MDTWKKEVCDGSSPVLPGGTTTSTGATRPTRAGAPTCKKRFYFRSVLAPTMQTKLGRHVFKCQRFRHAAFSMIALDIIQF